MFTYNTQLLETAAGANVSDQGSVIRKKVIRSEVETSALIEPETEALLLNPVMWETVNVGLSLLLHLLPRLGWRMGGRLVRDGGRVGSEGRQEAGTVLRSLQVFFQEIPIVPFQLSIFPGAEGHVGHLQNMVPVGGETHHHASVEEEKLACQLLVEFLRGALGQSFSQHAAYKLDFIQSPVILGDNFAASHDVDTFVWPLGGPLDDACPGAELSRAHMLGQLGYIHGLTIASDGPVRLQVDTESLYHSLIRHRVNFKSTFCFRCSRTRWSGSPVMGEVDSLGLVGLDSCRESRGHHSFEETEVEGLGASRGGVGTGWGKGGWVKRCSASGGMEKIDRARRRSNSCLCRNVDRVGCVRAGRGGWLGADFWHLARRSGLDCCQTGLCHSLIILHDTAMLLAHLTHLLGEEILSSSSRGGRSLLLVKLVELALPGIRGFLAFYGEFLFLGSDQLGNLLLN